MKGAEYSPWDAFTPVGLELLSETLRYRLNEDPLLEPWESDELRVWAQEIQAILNPPPPTPEERADGVIREWINAHNANSASGDLADFRERIASAIRADREAMKAAQ